MADQSFALPEEAQSLEARIAVADGGGQQVAINAALSYLPEDLQAEYERKSAPLIAQFAEAEAAESEAAPDTAEEGFVFAPGSAEK